MKVFVPPHWSRAIIRVADALKQYAPHTITCVDRPDQADLVVLHVIGRFDQVQRELDWGLRRGQQYALIQYVVRSSQKPSTEYWAGSSNNPGPWQRAKVVWSYYDLNALLDEDNWGFSFIPASQFYHAPLGVDTAVFRDQRMPRRYKVMTHGSSWLTEGVREATLAATAIVGEEPGRHPSVHMGKLGRVPFFVEGADDRELAEWYSRCEYVCALRRTEGFELPAAEGLLCGARPILFDRPHYRQWYGDWAEYIPERDRAHVRADLERLFRAPRRPVTVAEQIAAASRFSWPTIVKGFWDRCLQ